MEDEGLQDLAASVADGQDVDWQEAEQEASDEEMKKVVRALREISAVAQAHQSWHESLTAQASREEELTLERWGNLVILEKVGEGSFGEVFRARDPQLDREVALKLLRHADESGTDQETAVIEEGRLLARVRHPNVATVYGADRRDGRVGLWMELLQGRTLAELVREQGPLGAMEATLVGLYLCRALAAVHAKGILPLRERWSVESGPSGGGAQGEPWPNSGPSQSAHRRFQQPDGTTVFRLGSPPSGEHHIVPVLEFQGRAIRADHPGPEAHEEAADNAPRR